MWCVWCGVVGGVCGVGGCGVVWGCVWCGGGVGGAIVTRSTRQR